MKKTNDIVKCALSTYPELLTHVCKQIPQLTINTSHTIIFILTYRALRVLNDMDNANVLPTVVTFNTLIESCARNGKAQRAREVLELMKKRGLNPDERSFSAVVQVIRH